MPLLDLGVGLGLGVDLGLGFGFGRNDFLAFQRNYPILGCGGYPPYPGFPVCFFLPAACSLQTGSCHPACPVHPVRCALLFFPGFPCLPRHLFDPDRECRCCDPNVLDRRALNAGNQSPCWTGRVRLIRLDFLNVTNRHPGYCCSIPMSSLLLLRYPFFYPKATFDVPFDPNEGTGGIFPCLMTHQRIGTTWDPQTHPHRSALLRRIEAASETCDSEICLRGMMR